MKNVKPINFNPSIEDQERIAQKLAKQFTTSKVVVTKDGQKYRGKLN